MEKIIAVDGSPVVLARICSHEQGSTLELHVVKNTKSRSASQDLQVLAAHFNADKVIVRRHDQNELMRPRSLQTLVEQFADGEIVYDPTGAFAGMVQCVWTAQAIRMAAGNRVEGIYLEPTNGTMYVMPKISGTGAKAIAAIGEMLKDASAAIAAQIGDGKAEKPLRVVAMMEAPQGFSVIPVDAMSARSQGAGKAVSAWRNAFAAMLASLGIIAVPAIANAELPKMGATAAQTDTDQSAWYGPSAGLFETEEQSTAPFVSSKFAIEILDTEGLRRLQNGEPARKNAALNFAPASLAIVSFSDDGLPADSRHIVTSLSDLFGDKFAKAISAAADGVSDRPVDLRTAQLAPTGGGGGYGGTLGSDTLN